MQLPEGTVKHLQAAVLDAAGRFRTKMRSPALVLCVTDLPRLDIRIEITKRRIRFLKRRIEQDPALKDTVSDIMLGISDYNRRCPKGPAALIMRDLEMVGMELTPDLVLKALGEIDIAIMTEPTEVTTRRLTTMGQKTH